MRNDITKNSKVMKIQVLILALAQALYQIINIIVITVGGLAGKQLSNNFSFRC